MEYVPNGNPTPEEIREMCRKIREGWSENEHWRRRGYADGKPELTVMRCRVHVAGK
jgi:hypothetical protein